MMQVNSQRKAPDEDNDDDGDDFEYGDTPSNAIHADSSDYSAHQFLTTDDARDAGSSDGDDDAATEDQRSQALAGDDHFNSDETPDFDSFVQAGASKARATRGVDDDDDGDDFEY